MTPVKDRLARRIEVLTTIALDGVGAFERPPGSPPIEVPDSLNKCRKWDDPTLGIEAIGDPAAFTTNHKIHGGKVKQIAALIQRLATSRARRPPRSATAEAATLRGQLAEAKAMIGILTGQAAAHRQGELNERQLRLDAERTIRNLRERERERTQLDQRRAGLSRPTLVGAGGDA